MRITVQSTGYMDLNRLEDTVLSSSATFCFARTTARVSTSRLQPDRRESYLHPISVVNVDIDVQYTLVCLE